MKKYFSLIKNKKASVTVIALFAIMCILFPLLSVIYDIGMIHIYKQDLKNIQELSGTTCVPDAAAKVTMPKECQNLAKAYVNANLGGQGLPHADQKLLSQIGQLRNTGNGLPMCSDSGVKTTRLCRTGEEIVSAREDGNKIKVQIINIKYKPMFLTKALLNFGRQAKKLPKDDGYALNIQPSYFSPTYQQNIK